MSNTGRLGGAQRRQEVPRYEDVRDRREGSPLIAVPAQGEDKALDRAIERHAREAERYRPPLVRLPPPTW